MKIKELLAEEMLENGKIIIALDDTTYAKSGKKISNKLPHGKAFCLGLANK